MSPLKGQRLEITKWPRVLSRERNKRGREGKKAWRRDREVGKVRERVEGGGGCWDALTEAWLAIAIKCRKKKKKKKGPRGA